MKAFVIFSAIGAFLYLLWHSSKAAHLQAAPPIVVTPSTPTRGLVLRQPTAAIRPAPFLNGPSPVIVNDPNLLVRGGAPSQVAPVFGDPLVTPKNDIHPALDYPGIQTYMVDPSSLYV